MKLQQIVGTSSVSELVRRRVEQRHFYSAATAEQMIRREFPNHIVTKDPGQISVLVRDESFAIAIFKEVL